MKALNNLKKLFKRETQSNTSSAETTSIFRNEIYHPSFISGRNAMAVAAVYRCVSLLSESVANLPIQYMKRSGSIFVNDEESRLFSLLTIQPNDATSASEFWCKVVQRVLLDGNAYIVPVRSSVLMDYERLVLCSRGAVDHDTVHDLYHVNDPENALFGTFGEMDIIHLKGVAAINDKVGVSVLSYARLTLDISAVGENETLNRFSNGGNVRGIITNDSSVRGFGEYQDEQLERTASSMDERFQSGERIVSLPGQVDFKQLSLSSTDMQFLESRKFVVRDICRFFGVHPSFVFDDTSNNYKSAEMANVAFLNNTLNPLLRKIENELQRKLIPQQLWGKRKIVFDRKGIYATDLEGRAKYQAATIAAGLYTVNEWRAAENKLPIDGGDTVLVSANLKSINDPTSSGKNNDNDNAEK